MKLDTRTVHHLGMIEAAAYMAPICERRASAAAPAPVQTEAQQSEKDAEDANRYRFIRSIQHMELAEKERVYVAMTSAYDPLGIGTPATNEQYDAGVDAAIAAIAQEKANQKGGAA